MAESLELSGPQPLKSDTNILGITKGSLHKAALLIGGNRDKGLRD
jgi:hypothetical protein